MASNNDRIQKIQTLAKKGEWKKAYKEAKFSLKLSNSSEIKQIVVNSLWNWIKDQVQRNQYDEAKLNVRELLQIDANSIPQNIRNEFPPIFLTLGLNSLLPDDLKNDTTSTNIQAQYLDQYIIRNIKSNDLLSETLKDADKIKETFKLIESRKDSEALQILSSIPFQSPASEWRLLIRGLIALYNNDNKTANENWQRLNNSRPTSKIADNLKKLFKDKNKSEINNDTSKQFNLFKDNSDSEQSRKINLIDNLRIIGDCLKSKKYKEVLVRLQIIRQSAKIQNDRLYGRILRLIQIYLLNHAQPITVRQFIEQNLPLPLDPNGNRTLALLLRRLFNRNEQIPLWMQRGEFYFFWEKFAEEDIDQIESFSPAMKARAKSIAFSEIINEGQNILLNINPIGEQFFDRMAEGIKNSDDNFSILFEENWNYWRLQYHNKSIDADPTNFAAFDDLKILLETMIKTDPNPDKFNVMLDELYARMLKHNPNENKILYRMFNKSINNDLDKAAEYMECIERNNPISKNTTYCKLKLTVQQCRHALANRNLPAAEKYLTAFENLLTGNLMPFHRHNLILLALKFIFYILSNKQKSAKKILTSYKEYGVGNSFSIIIAILYETKNIIIPQQFIDHLQQLYDSKIKKRLNPSAIGAIADFLVEKINFNVSKIPDDSTMSLYLYFSELLDYICKKKTIKWTKEKDLIGVCGFLWLIVLDYDFWSRSRTNKIVMQFYKFAQNGKKLFPNSPILKFFALEASRCNYIKKSKSSWKSPYFWQGIIMKMNNQYKEFINTYSKSKDNPELSSLIACAEIRTKCSIPEVLKKNQ
ncbi:MAG: hypothetical protein LBB88_05555 [Planctomycetaceae bacterium]|jgi:hypothetical protein|nr:hypothetical protein [Planctomycetaceae bacterium]